MMKNINWYNYQLFTWGLNLGMCVGMTIAYFVGINYLLLFFGVLQAVMVIGGFKKESAKLQDHGLFQGK